MCLGVLLIQFIRTPEAIKPPSPYTFLIPGNSAHIDSYNIANAAMLCSRSRSCTLLAEAGYYEARGESDEGMVAVMDVVLNRVHHKKWANTVHGVLTSRCEFSYTCDGSLRRGKGELLQWERAKRLAYLLKAGYITSSIGDATHFHAKNVNPRWGFPLVATIGNHSFYKCQEGRC